MFGNHWWGWWKMKLRFWGVRGSYPVPGSDTVRYGGNTSCVEVRLNDGTLIILDAGSGLRELGKQLMATEFARGKGQATILLTHTHWDHIMGFPHFEPARVAGNRFEIYGRGREGALSLSELFERQQSSEFCDHSLSEFDADIDFQEIVEGDIVAAGSATISCARLNHPNYALGYRITADSKSLVYVTDTSPYSDVLIGDHFIKDVSEVTPEDNSPQKQEMARLHASLLRLLRKADMVVYDTCFEPEGYNSRPHWGHSTPEDAMANCRSVGARRLVLFHHAPENTDSAMDKLKDKYCGNGSSDLETIMSHEGMELAV
jgi:phosphoribosyl 1,2-cyclic phosphodiesterase